jgi:hypothetical protein
VNVYTQVVEGTLRAAVENRSGGSRRGSGEDVGSDSREPRIQTV